MMSYNNNWVNELKESYIEEKKAMNVVKKGAEVVAKGAKVAAKVAKKVGKGVVKALGTRGGSFEARHLGRGGTYDHVEHEGNNLQEEMALNEDLLMLIDILCEELGIDVEQLDEKKLFDPVFGHAGIDNNPKARKFNPETARANKVKLRNWLMRVGRAGYGLSNPESKSVNDGRHILRQRIKEAIEQLGEATRRPKVEPIGGNPAPYGYKRVGGKTGKKGQEIGGRFVPLTHDEWRAANPERDWDKVNTTSREHARKEWPDNDEGMTGPDDHLPGGVGAAAREARLAAIRAHRRRQRG